MSKLITVNESEWDRLEARVKELERQLEYNISALSKADRKLQELENTYAPKAIEVIDGVISDKSQDADWLRARYFEGTRRIEELEDGCCRFNCRTGKRNFARGCEWALGFLPDEWEEVYDELKRREKWKK